MSGSGTGTAVTGTPGGVGWGMVTAPTIEPLTLAEFKSHLVLDSGTFADNIVNSPSIYSGLHVTTMLYSLIGTGVDVAGKQAIVYLECGPNGATGTVDVKIQEYNGATWADWTGGAFTQVTTSNDNATYEIAYTGTASQIRTIAKVLLASCEFGTSIVTNAAITSDDANLTDLIQEAREEVEKITRRALLTQTWDYVLDEFPCKNYIRLPLGNLQSVTSLTYKNSDGVIATMTKDTDYLVEPNGDQYGKIVLPYGVSWPSFTAYPSNPITIRFVCGWTTAALLPKTLKRAVKFIAEQLYYHADRDDVLRDAIKTLTDNHRLWGTF